MRRRREFDEDKVVRWPAESPGSRGGEFAPKTAGWLGAVEARLPPIGSTGAPGPARPRAGRPPAKPPASKPSTTPRPAAQLMEKAQAAGWTASVKYRRRPKAGDLWEVTFERRGRPTVVGSWTKDPGTGRVRWSGEGTLKAFTAEVTAGPMADDDQDRLAGWVKQLTDRIDRRKARPYGDVPDDQLRVFYDAFLTKSGGLDEDLLRESELIWDEMVRRDAERLEEGLRLGDGMDLSPEQLAVDDLVARGMDYLTAVEQVYGKLDLVERRMGETQRAAIRRVYQEWLALSYLAAESFTNGHMVNAKGRDRHVGGKPAPISPRSLFSGPTARAAKYASPELLEFWETHPRLTLAQFTAQVTRADSRETQRTRLRAQDLGLKT